MIAKLEKLFILIGGVLPLLTTNVGTYIVGHTFICERMKHSFIGMNNFTQN